MRYIAEFTENEQVVGHYHCKKKELLTSKTGKPYLSLKLADKTGEIDAKVWEPAVNVGPFEAGDYVKIEATAQLYQQALQLRVVRLRQSQAGEYQKRDYIPATERDIDEMYAKLLSYIDTIQNPYIAALLKAVFLDDETMREKFKEHSAAKSMHHAYLGGLLEHTLSVTELCDFMSGHYPQADRDVLVACAMMHDAGKVYELDELPNSDYTDDGELIGHIVIISELAARAADKIPGFPHALKSLIQHALLAHHGEFEFGSPKLPKTLEAYLLHACDNLDAKTQVFLDTVKKRKSPANWLGWNRMLERNIRTSDY